ADGSHRKVATDSGLSVVATAADGSRPAEGALVELFVRPDSIAILRRGEAKGAGPGPTNELQGVLESLLFNGANSRALVRTDQGESIALALPQTDEARALSEGAPLSIGFAAGQCLCFPLAAAAG